MAVRVAGDVRRKIRKYPGAIVIQVQRCSDAEAAAAALMQAAAEIAALDGSWESAPGLEPGETVGPKFVSNVAKLPTGPFLWLDGGHTPDDLLATIPDIVARHLADAGVGTATIAFPETRAPLYDENGLAVGRPRRAAVLCLYPPPVWRPGSVRARAPASWIEEAAAWVQGDLGPDDPMWAMVVSLALPITAGDGVALLQQARRAGSGCLVAGDLEARARVAEGMFIGVDRIGLGAGGPVTTDEEVLADFERLRAIARRLAPTMAYAFVAIMPYLGSSNPDGLLGPDRWGHDPHRRNGLSDQIVFDAFAYQILGPGHLERLRAGASAVFEPSPLSPGPVPLAGDLVELSIGDPAAWLLDRPRREEVTRAARQLLGPCLLSREEGIALYDEKFERVWGPR